MWNPFSHLNCNPSEAVNVLESTPLGLGFRIFKVQDLLAFVQFRASG